LYPAGGNNDENKQIADLINGLGQNNGSSSGMLFNGLNGGIEDEILACIRIKHSVLMGRARPIKTLCFMRIEWLKFDDYVPARITKKSLGSVPFLRFTILMVL